MDSPQVVKAVMDAADEIAKTHLDHCIGEETTKRLNPRCNQWEWLSGCLI